MPEHPHRSDRSALDAWLRQAEEVLADQREYSISPSFAEALAAHQPYQTVLAMSVLAEGLEALLGRLVADPGRWILIIEAGRERDPRYVQYLLFEDGSLVAEGTSNRYLKRSGRLGPVQEQRLAALGWQAPTDDGSKNWSLVDDSFSPDVAAAAWLGIETLQSVFAVKNHDLVAIRMLSSRRRGGTPASPTYSADDPASAPFAVSMPPTDCDLWAAVRAQQWNEMDGFPSAINVDQWAARAARAFLAAQGRAAEIRALQAIDPTDPTPAPGLDELLARADTAAHDAHEAAVRARAEGSDFCDRGADAVSCTRHALDTERVARQLAQLLMGVNACRGERLANVRDRLAVAVINDPITGAGVRADGLKLFAVTDDERLPEIAGLISRLLIEPGAQATVGPMILRTDFPGQLTVSVGADTETWVSPVRVHEVATVGTCYAGGVSLAMGVKVRLPLAGERA